MEQSIVKKNLFKESAAIKLAAIGVLIVILLLPSRMIESLIRERAAISREVVDEVASKWGNKQTVTGPFISVPYLSTDTLLTSNITEYFHIMPEELTVEGKLVPEIRYRGIYRVILYNTVLNIKGRFIIPGFSSLDLNSKKIFREKSFLAIGLPDLRGIREQIRIKMNDKEYLANPGLRNKDLVSNGVFCNLDSLADSVYNFSLTLNLIGKEELYFTPLGKKTNIRLNSSWSTPSFDGTFLPQVRSISDSGFVAEWSVLDLNRDFPQVWKGDAFQVEKSSFGLKLLFPVDHYLKSLRSSKYAILFIILTFLVFFFIEMLNKKKIHPIQYLFIGAGLCIFYTLLVALSEQIDFNISYLISSIAVITLITSYTGMIVRSAKVTILLGFIMSLLYGFLFTILQLEDYSLLFGSIALFVILAIVMFVSRKVNWYSPLKIDNEEPQV